jgi:hypothetical protein
MMDIREKRVYDYFNSWITKDHSHLDSIFASDITYIECYGPVYNGIKQIKKWFSDWNKQSTVLEWRIKQFIHENHIIAVEWYFKCDCGGKISGFDGVSLIEFDDKNKIKSVKEFQSKSEHIYPYQ